MKRILALAACLLFSVAAPAQDEAQFEEIMERGNQMVGSLALNLQAKDVPAIVADSKTVQEIFGQIYAFFEKRNVPDAMEFARNAQVGFKAAGDLAADGKLAEALAKFHATRANCDGCHKAHRGKDTEGNYKIIY